LVIFRVQFRALIDQAGDLDRDGRLARPPFSGGLSGATMQLAGAVGLVAGVLFLLWFSRSAANAQALGLPARREPAAGVAGFVIPVINLWWPYQSTCDLLPQGDARRSLVLRWFLLWMVGGFAGAIFSWVSIFVDGPTGWLVLALPAALTTLAALSARRVVSEVVAAHAALAPR